MEALEKNGVQNKIVLYPNSCNIDACYNEVDLYLVVYRVLRLPTEQYGC